ncbi:MAG TPA: hypothetical protein VMB26_17375 [Candidatus Binataceae bacterium]|nr:hypothetical protein [Candidatus Binataceae bacterium]
MRKALFVITVAILALLWAGHNQTTYASGTTTYSCQGQNNFPVAPGITISDGAVWSVTTLNSKFTSGFLVASFFTPDGSAFCAFELDTRNSGFYSEVGFMCEGLAWDFLYGDLDCEDFEDQVFLLSSGTQGVMNDVNLDDDDSPGWGTCIVH